MAPKVKVVDDLGSGISEGGRVAARIDVEGVGINGWGLHIGFLKELLYEFIDKGRIYTN